MALTQLKTAAIADDAVTEDKLANAINTARAANTAKTTNATHTGDVTGSGSLTIADNAVTLAKMAGGTDGQIITYDASGDPVAVGPGTDGQVLTSTGAGSPPAFEAIPASGRSYNIIVNGEMSVAQRGTSSTSTGYATVDRMNWGLSGHSVTVTQSQHALTSSDTGPWEKGFRHSAHIALSGAGTMATNTTMSMFYKVEAQDIANSGWEYTNTSSNITVSFWLKVSTVQTFYLLLYTSDGTSKSIVKEVTPANTNWNKFTFTIPGHADLQFDNDNGEGLSCALIVTYGTNKTGSGNNLNSWGNYNDSERVPDMASTWLTAGASTYEFTGLQLEVGDSASDYPHESYGENLARCQRYYHSVSQAVWNNIVYQNHYFPTTMRANPTITSTSTGPNATRKNNWYGKKSSGGIEGGVSFDWTASAEL